MLGEKIDLTLKIEDREISLKLNMRSLKNLGELTRLNPFKYLYDFIHEKDEDNKNKLIAAICAAPIVLKLSGVLENKLATVYPDKEFVEILGSNYVDKKVHIDKNIITACGAGQTFNFSFEILRQLGINPENIKKSMQI